MKSKDITNQSKQKKIGFLLKVADRLLRESTFLMANYQKKNQKRLKILGLVRNTIKECGMCLALGEGMQICTTVQGIEKIKGDIAEVGVYTGGSAKLICKTKQDKSLHLFDTFEGLPDLTAKDDRSLFHKDQFNDTSLESVKNYLKQYKNVYFYKGEFPETAKPITNKSFSFVHLDVDLYKPTLDCLEFFYPRVNRGGIIISHDYQTSSGVRKAVDEFFANKPEVVIEILDSQCIIVKA